LVCSDMKNINLRRAPKKEDATALHANRRLIHAENKTDKKIEKELDTLLWRLAKIQDAIGDDLFATEGGGEVKAKDRFHEVRSQVIKRLNKIRELLDESKDGALLKKPEAQILNQQAIRENFHEGDDELSNLDALFQKEAAKKRSKLTKEDLAGRKQMVQALRQNFMDLKDEHKSQYAPLVHRNRATDITPFEDSELFQRTGKEAGSSFKNLGPKVKREAQGPNVAYQEEKISLEQQQRLDQQLQRDREQDHEYLSRIEQGVEEAQEIALTANEELKRQGVIIDALDVKLEKVTEHAENVNKKLKKVLEQVRAADKLCLDIICIIILLGLIGLFYEMSRNTTMNKQLTHSVSNQASAASTAAKNTANGV